ncbi:hypothetical protein [Mycobacterium sp. DL592]|uniref:hypothetical protein n=1 Tax=Mycobacterium sp. DL592 TaxID=2675524 RepID=UPI00141F6995|nr:hypothetical protein [Mycobacterium sp. DL592]
MTKLLTSLTEAEFLLIRETEPAALTDLDEDALLELHRRIRRARNKYVKLYRRKGAAKVPAKGARGAARSANERNGAKAEIFEGALGRVSKQLGIAAARSARELKQERLERARQEGSPLAPAPPAKSKGKVATKGRIRADETRKSPGRKKREAGSKAAGARRQAKRDSR